MPKYPNVTKTPLYEVSRHPLVVLVFTTLIGSLLVPFVTRQVDAHRQLANLRTEHATQIMQSAQQVDAQLNLMVTAIDNFYKDQLDASTPSDVGAFRSQLYRLYEEYERQAWWWHWQALQECDLLGLLTERARAEFGRAAEEYQANLVASTRALDPGWALARRANASRQDVTPAVEHMLSQSATLWQDRQRLVRVMVRAVRP